MSKSTLININDRINNLAQWMFEAKHLVIFTGAGISTESGLSDFRGPDGIWTRQAKGLPTERIDFSTAAPNNNHTAIFELQEMGKLGFLISQNIDNLHLRSGIRQELIAELHGNITRLRCANCGFIMDNLDDLSNCPLCDGKLASSVVDFGQSLPQKALADSYAHSEKADVFLVVGSSLVVYPAADMPTVAYNAGARLIIINQGETPLDKSAPLLFREATGEVLPLAVEKLKLMLKKG